MEIQDSHSTLLHALRFRHLGKAYGNYKELANSLGITTRYMLDLRKKDKRLSTGLLDRIAISLQVNRCSPVRLVRSPLSLMVDFALQRAYSLEELRILNSYMVGVFATQADSTSDYGLLGLAGAISFALWNLETTKSHKDKETLLINACDRWSKAAAHADDALVRLTFEVNALTAKIYHETFFKHGGQQQASVEHYRAYRHYALQTRLIHAWRDAVEQAALLANEDSDSDSQRATDLDNDFKSLLDCVRDGDISTVEQQHVLLPELGMIDGFPALERCPSFIAWRLSMLNNESN